MSYFRCNSADIPPLKVQQLVEQLQEVDDWHTLGVALGVPVPQLKEIERSNPKEGVRRWKVEMFQYWLNLNPTASWKDVTRALEVLGHLSLAARLKSDYVLQRGQQLESPGKFEDLLLILWVVYIR